MILLSSHPNMWPEHFLWPCYGLAHTYNSTMVWPRDATIYQYIVYRIVISLYQHQYKVKLYIDILHIMTYQCIVACFNDLQSNYCTLWST